MSPDVWPISTVVVKAGKAGLRSIGLRCAQELRISSPACSAAPDNMLFAPEGLWVGDCQHLATSVRCRRGIRAVPIVATCLRHLWWPRVPTCSANSAWTCRSVRAEGAPPAICLRCLDLPVSYNPLLCGHVHGWDLVQIAVASAGVAFAPLGRHLRGPVKDLHRFAAVLVRRGAVVTVPQTFSPASPAGVMCSNTAVPQCCSSWKMAVPGFSLCAAEKYALTLTWLLLKWVHVPARACSPQCRQWP